MLPKKGLLVLFCLLFVGSALAISDVYIIKKTGAVGATGPPGPAGTNGTNGVNGINGTNGINGVNGTNGAAGLNATANWTLATAGNVSLISQGSVVNMTAGAGMAIVINGSNPIVMTLINTVTQYTDALAISAAKANMGNFSGNASTWSICVGTNLSLWNGVSFTCAVPAGGSGSGALNANSGGWQNSSTLVWLANNATNVSINNTNLFVDTLNNRVGIGTSVPGWAFTVNGTANISGTFFNTSQIVTPRGAAQWVSTTVTGDLSGSTGIGTTGNLALFVGCTYQGACGSKRMEIASSNGFVTLSSSQFNAVNRLHVDGGIFANGGNITMNKSQVTLRVFNGTNGCIGAIALSSTATVVNTTCVLNSSLVLLTRQVESGTVATTLDVGTRVDGVSFTINTNNILDTSVVGWFIIQPMQTT